ncbi:hypothetical protein JQ628_07000 [Bradyrhizobium lablabi]|uniref:glycoside hydrolase family 26 protein n=1 Tax=Bradyrhizobium lablabi TaxID=722472 RepID=UPI001BAD4176|nr:hypothetical protein [Bradyrhizobium lablabi]MBR1121257.1 hypothetical protein [Bradyrhizobium lablabi]
MSAIDRLRRSLLMAAIGVAASGMAAAYGKAGSLPRSDSARLAGAFVDWGQVGREHTLQQWEKWLNQKPSSVIAVDFYNDDSWEKLSRFTWVPGVWKKLNPARNVAWSLPLTMKDTPLSDVAEGKHDAEFEQAARAIAEAQPRAIIRLGWEMNLEQMVWFTRGHEADYIAAFRRVVGIFRKHSRDFRFDWCPGWGPQETPADLAYPGDDVVDIIGLDVYDFKYDGTPEERWEKFYLKAPFGLEWHRDFAAKHNKLMSYPEWGVGHFGDNPYFIRKMHEWFMQNRDHLAYAGYFNVDGLWPTRIDTGRFPQSEKLFRKLFSGSAVKSRGALPRVNAVP